MGFPVPDQDLDSDFLFGSTTIAGSSRDIRQDQTWIKASLPATF